MTQDKSILQEGDKIHISIWKGDWIFKHFEGEVKRTDMGLVWIKTGIDKRFTNAIDAGDDFLIEVTKE